MYMSVHVLVLTISTYVYARMLLRPLNVTISTWTINKKTQEHLPLDKPRVF